MHDLGVLPWRRDSTSTRHSASPGASDRGSVAVFRLSASRKVLIVGIMIVRPGRRFLIVLLSGVAMSWEQFRRVLVGRRAVRDTAVDGCQATRPTTSETPLVFESLEPRLLLAADPLLAAA